MDQTPFVSIGMPVFNDLPFLSKALDSLLGQTYGHFELIISDDCSTDGSEAVCRAYAAKDTRIRYIRQAHNIGISNNMNCLLAEAKGDFFMLAADDDWWDSLFIELMVGALVADAAVVSVFCPIAYINEADEMMASHPPRFISYQGDSAFSRLHQFIRIFDDSLGYGLFRRNAIDGLKFPVWWGINRRNAYNNLYPPICFLLAKGDTRLVGDRPLWHNRMKSGKAVHHKTPFSVGSPAALPALTLQKINLIWCATAQIVAAGKKWTAFAILPVMIWHWFVCAVSASMIRGIRQRLVVPSKESAASMVLSQLAVHVLIFASLPLISRWYLPESAGIWVFFQSSILLLWSFSQLRTDQMMMTTDDEQQRSDLFALGLTAHLCCSGLMAGILALFKWENIIPSGYLGLMVIYWIGFGAMQLLISVYAARKSFSTVNTIRLATTIVAYPLALPAWYFLGDTGLIISLLLSVWLPVLWLLKERSIALPSPLRLRSTFLQNRLSNFWMTGNSLLVAANDQVFTMAIAAIYDLKTAGAFFFAQRIILAPVSLMAGTYGVQYFRQMHEAFRQRSLTSAFFIGYWFKWLPIALVFYGVVAIWGGPLFTVLFGDAYTMIGLWVGALALRGGVQFLSSPVSAGFYVLQQPRYPFFSAFISSGIILLSVYCMAWHILPLPQILWMHSLLVVLNVVIYNIVMLKAIRRAQHG